MSAIPLDDVDEQLRAVINNLYILILHAHDPKPEQTQQTLAAEIKLLVTNLQQLSQAAKSLPNRLPLEIIEYVEGSRNPDIYTREFVELVMRYNQQQAGRSQAFGLFRDILGEMMVTGIPDIKDDVVNIVEATGGQLP